MSVKILMPALSPTMEKGNLAKWLKQEGDTIKSGDIIAEIETDKATMEVEAVDEGVLAKIIVPEGTADVPVNEVIAVIAEEGEDVAAVAAAGAGAAPVTAAASAPAAEAAPAQMAHAEAAPVPLAQSAAPAAAAASHGERIFASPLARRLAKEAGIDIAAIKGTGPHGRIIERDVQSAAKSGVTQQVAAPAAAAPAPAAAPKRAAAAGAGDEAVKKLFAPGSYEELPNDNMRKTIARRLLESKQTVPHFYLSVDTELDALLALREQINAAAPKDKDGKPAYKVSVNDFVIKALALSLRQVPDANVSWTDAAILRHKAVDVGVAVAIPGGLITPVVRNADIKSISTISNEMKDFAARARARKLRPDEYQGGSTAVSNLGMFGIKSFSAIINPPHATILAVGAGEKRVVVKDGAPAVATVMTVTLSTDHRAVDGALGAELLAAFKPLIENPLGLLV